MDANPPSNFSVGAITTSQPSGNSAVLNTPDAVQFVCNSCHSNLNLDRSLVDLENNNLLELGIAIPQGTEPGDTNLIQSAANNAPISRLGRDAATAAKIFDIVSGAGELDHPLCEDCADSLLDQLDRELKATEKLCSDYSSVLSQLLLEEQSQTSMSQEQAALETEVARYTAEMEKLEAENNRLDVEIAKETEEQRTLSIEQQQYYQRYADSKRRISELEDDYFSAKLANHLAEQQLKRLTQTSGLSAAFHIWHCDHFGTINNLRLGRLPTAVPENAEVNAAWGAATLLLCALAKKLNVHFKRFRPVPYGSNSYIEDLGDDQETVSDSRGNAAPDATLTAAGVESSSTHVKHLPLYGTGNRFLSDDRYDDAMSAFAQCVQQLAEAVEKMSDGQFKLPYPVDSRSRLLDQASRQHYSVRRPLNNEQKWTRALKMLLTNLKWATSFASSMQATRTFHTPPASTGGSVREKASSSGASFLRSDSSTPPLSSIT